MMLAKLLVFIRVTLAFALVALNTLVHALPLLALALVKAVVPWRQFRRACSRVLVLLAESWIAVNSALIRFFARTRFEIEGGEQLRPDGWYLVLSNHQSWVDIPVLQKTFNKRIPFLKFFLKDQLIWVPVLGLAWWALDFPFMKRYSQQTLAQHPQLRGTDVQATRKACERFRELPVSVMNFVEGTRFAPHKHAQQHSPYAHLLRPKAGGVAFVLQAMGQMLQSIVDVTIVYPGGRPSMIDLVAGRVRAVRLLVRQLPIPRDLIGGDYENDTEFRERFQRWINALWADKDAAIARLSAAAAPPNNVALGNAQ